MDILPYSIHEITTYHEYKPGTRTSVWRGLNEKTGKIGGSKLDELRNTVPVADWVQLIAVVDNNLSHLPNKQQTEWKEAKLKLSDFLDNKFNYNGEFSDYIADKNSNWKIKMNLQKCLWQLMSCGAECLIFCNYEVAEPRSN